MGNIVADIKNGIIFDGAMGSMLIDAGLTGGKPSEAWVLERPDEIKKVHQAYTQAGANVATTCSFGGSRLKLEAAGLADMVEIINLQAVHLARDAIGNKGYVAGNIGPTGQLLKPNGALSKDEAQRNYADQAGVLAKGGVDFFLLATFYDLLEMESAIHGVKSVSDKPVFATMSFQETGRGFFTIMGNRVQESMTAMLEAGAFAVGANCTLTSNRMVVLAQTIRQTVPSPVLIQPNAGNPEVIEGKTTYTEDPKTFAENMSHIKLLGVEALGGCCGTTPAHIRRMKETILDYK